MLSTIGPIIHDVSSAEGIAKIVKETIDRLGGVDVLVNVVGGSSSPPGGVLALSDDDWQRDLNKNLFSAVRLDRSLDSPYPDRGRRARSAARTRAPRDR